MTDTVSPLLDRRTTKSRAVIFAGVRSVGHANVAKALCISESTFSEWFSKYGDRIALLLTTIDKKPVDIGSKCVSPARAEEIEREFENLRFWAKKGIDLAQFDKPHDAEQDTAINFE